MYQLFNDVDTIMIVIMFFSIALMIDAIIDLRLGEVLAKVLLLYIIIVFGVALI